jgi:hypothetical protein
MPGVPSSRGCDACRKQKKKVRMGTCLHQGHTDEDWYYSAIWPNLHVRDAVV